MMSSQITIADLPKLKVQDLKKELKTRELAVSGNKSELLERLEEALKAEEAEALLEEPGNDTEDEAVLEDLSVAPSLSDTTAVTTPKAEVAKTTPAAPAVPSSPVKAVAATPKDSTTPADATPAAQEEKTTAAESQTAEQKKLSRAERFGIVAEDAAKAKRAERFGIVSEEDKKAQRAAKFGIATENGSAKDEDDAEKKSKRAERFGISATDSAAKTADSTEMTEEARQRLLKRKERFGEVTSTLVNKVETDEKIKARAARFGAIADGAVSTEDEAKKQKRMERFAAA